MDLGLNGSRALITGGSRGIGFAIAGALAAEVGGGRAHRPGPGGPGRGGPDPGRPRHDGGHRGGRRHRHARAAPRRGRDRGRARRPGSPGGQRGGVAGGGNLTNSGDGEFAATLVLNAGHAAELIRAGLPHLRAAGGGAVVIISSITGLRPAPRTAYAAAKAAENQLAAAAAQELGLVRHPGERGQPRLDHLPRRRLGHLPPAQPRRLRRVRGQPVPVRPPGPPGRGRRCGHLPAVPAGLVGDRRERRGLRRPDLPGPPAFRRAVATR